MVKVYFVHCAENQITYQSSVLFRIISICTHPITLLLPRHQYAPMITKGQTISTHPKTTPRIPIKHLCFLIGTRDSVFTLVCATTSTFMLPAISFTRRRIVEIPWKAQEYKHFKSTYGSPSFPTLTFLSILIDTQTFELQLPVDEQLWSSKQSSTRKESESFLGHLSHITKPGQTFLRELFARFKAAQAPHHFEIVEQKRIFVGGGAFCRIGMVHHSFQGSPHHAMSFQMPQTITSSKERFVK